MKIDAFNHIFPRRYYDQMLELAPLHKDMGRRVREIPALYDLDVRFRAMDPFGEYRQILTLASPPIEAMVGPDHSALLARIANDGMAELVGRYPDRFVGFAASLPMDQPEAALREAIRALDTLGACGVQIFTNVQGRALDAPEFQPLFGEMARRDRPILVHPARGASFPDYQTERTSRYEIWWTFGWPYETSAFMARLVFSGLFDRHPDLKIVTHHMGGMVPYFEGRVGPGWDQLGARTSDEDLTLVLKSLRRRPLDYFRMFYGDTALFGARGATRCGLEFFGVDHVLFASDMPFDPEKGPMYIRETIRVLDSLELPAADLDAIYRRNAERLFHLTSA
jgi:predicted TIM-barrel fold metal-dependent hydrolase